MANLLCRNRTFPCHPRNASQFLQLPSTCRTFHSSPRPQFAEAIIPAVHSLFDGLHTATGLPWAYTIPLGALALRATITFPLALYSRHNLQKQVELNPLLYSWQHSLQREAMSEVGLAGPVKAQKLYASKFRAKQNEIYKRWGCGRWKNWLPFVQIPLWLLPMEAIREMSGQEFGLVTHFLKWFNKLFDITFQATTALEPSLANEGMLWFPNLMEADPHLVLPFLLSGTIILNISSGMARRPGTFGYRLKRGLMLVGLAIGPLTLQVPCAMLLYWISSSSMAYIQAILIDKIMPVKPPPTPTRWKIETAQPFLADQK